MFLENVFVPRKYSISSQRQFISALKLFIVFSPQCKIASLELQRPKKSNILPFILSQREILMILQATKNLKHRAIIALLYSSELRIGELTSSTLRNIDIERRQLKIEGGKGRKDRFVVLAESLKGSKYSESSILKFLYKSTNIFGVKKNLTPYTLRHSYTTHLLENGIGLRYIQEPLGHAKPETTMIYKHVAKK